MRLSVIIPVFNEAPTLQDLIGKVMEVPIEKEVIIIDDGSTDNTPQVLRNYKDKYGFKIVRHNSNQGKGMAIRSAINHVAGDITIIQDADLEYDPQDYLRLIEAMKKRGEPVMYGARTWQRKHSHIFSYLGSTTVTFFANLLYRQKLTDLPTCYKVFDSSLLKTVPLKCKGFEFDPEITARISKRGIKIKEVPIKYYPRGFKEGKKITWIDGVMAIWVLLKYRFVD